MAPTQRFLCLTSASVPPAPTPSPARPLPAGLPRSSPALPLLASALREHRCPRARPALAKGADRHVECPDDAVATRPKGQVLLITFRGRSLGVAATASDSARESQEASESRGNRQRGAFVLRTQLGAGPPAAAFEKELSSREAPADVQLDLQINGILADTLCGGAVPPMPHARDSFHAAHYVPPPPLARTPSELRAVHARVHPMPGSWAVLPRPATRKPLPRAAAALALTSGGLPLPP